MEEPRFRENKSIPVFKKYFLQTVSCAHHDTAWGYSQPWK